QGDVLDIELVAGFDVEGGGHWITPDWLAAKWLSKAPSSSEEGVGGGVFNVSANIRDAGASPPPPSPLL
ncbi:MAG TPA: hypothetical protein PK823_12005, partial [Novosphingobium sp.]|nr:hypothetical protein [Novosphingobium sp.]